MVAIIINTAVMVSTMDFGTPEDCCIASDPDFRTAAENAYRAVLDPNCNPLPLPKERYDEWKDLELSFNPKEMFS